MTRIRNRLAVGASLVVWVSLAGGASAGDWPQWRGPTRDGVAPPGPPLAETWPVRGPVKVWDSEQGIPSVQHGGMGSVSVANGRAYVYCNEVVREQGGARTVTEDVLDRLGTFPRHAPADLVQAVEEARTSAERQGLKPEDVKAWAARWVRENLNEDRRREYSDVVQTRLVLGKDVLDPLLLAKLAEVAGTSFDNAAKLTQWLADNGFDQPAQRRVLAAVPAVRVYGRDLVLCMDAATGKTLWRKEYPGWTYAYGASATITLAGGRLYLPGSNRCVYCLEADTGKLVWSAMTEEQPNRTSSSVLVLDGKAILLAGQLTAYDVETGEVIWRQKKVPLHDNSPACWEKDARKYLLCNTASEVGGPARVFCVDPDDGNVLWSVPGGSFSSVVTSGDVMVVQGNSGVTAYRLSPDRAEKMWSAPFGDRGASPVIWDGHVYAFSNKRFGCVDLQTGKAAWTEPLDCEISSPIAVDGKIIQIADQGGLLVMFKATPEKFILLGKAKMDIATCSSPAIADGRLFLRMGYKISCFDLTAAARGRPATRPSPVGQ